MTKTDWFDLIEKLVAASLPILGAYALKIWASFKKAQAAPAAFDTVLEAARAGVLRAEEMAHTVPATSVQKRDLAIRTTRTLGSAAGVRLDWDQADQAVHAVLGSTRSVSEPPPALTPEEAADLLSQESQELEQHGVTSAFDEAKAAVDGAIQKAMSK